jgi:hypothetical protein
VSGFFVLARSMPINDGFAKLPSPHGRLSRVHSHHRSTGISASIGKSLIGLPSL